MLEMQSTSSLSSKKSELSSSILKSQNNSSSTISMSEIQRSQSSQSLQLASQKSWIIKLEDVSKSSLLSSENLKQLERSRSERKKNSHREIRSSERSCSHISISSETSSQSSSSTFRNSRFRRSLRGRRSKASNKNKNDRRISGRNLRRSTKLDTLCSLTAAQLRPSIVSKFISTRSKNHDTFSLDRPISKVDLYDDDDDDDDYYCGKKSININPRKNLPLQNNGAHLQLNDKDDNKSQRSSILYAMLSPPGSPSKVDFSDIIAQKNDVCVQVPENDEENDSNSSPATNSDRTSIDGDSTETERKNPPLCIKISKEHLAEYELKKRRKKSKKAKKRRKEKKRSGSALSINKNEDRRKSAEFTNGHANNNEMESIPTSSNFYKRSTENLTENATELLEKNIENKDKPAPDTTTAEDESPKNIIINNNNVNSHLKPKLRFLSRTQALNLGIFEKNLRIINERKGMPPAKVKGKKAKCITKPKKKYVKQIKGKRRPGRPKKQANATAPDVKNIVDDTPYVEYEDGRKLPSLPFIDTPSRHKSEAANNDEDDSSSSSSSKKDYYPTAYEKFTREIGTGEKADNDNCDTGMAENVAEIRFCTESINDDGKNEKNNHFLVKYKDSVVNKPPIELMKPPVIPEDIENRSFGEPKPNLRKRIPRLAKKPLIVDDKILPKGTVNYESMSTSVVVKEQDGVKKTTVVVDKKRKNIFAPEVAKKRKLLHASEFNPPNESELNSFGIRSTVPSRQSLLPTKKIIPSEELYEKLSSAFKVWAKIPEISEMLNSNSSDKETIKPKISIKDRLGSVVKNDDKNDTEDRENVSKTSIKVLKIIDTINETAIPPENISCQIKSTQSIENTSKEMNKNASTSQCELKVQKSLEKTQNHTFERIATGNASTITRIAPKRSLDDDNLLILNKNSKRNCRSRYKREYDDDSDSSSSSESKMAMSVNKFEEKSINSETSSANSTKSITQRLTEWSKTGTEIAPMEVQQIDDNSNCHSPSSIKTVVNVSESSNRDCISSLNDDRNVHSTEQLDNNVDENVETHNSSDNDDDDNNDASSSSSSSSSASSDSKSTTNSLITTSGVGSVQNQQINESINNNLNAEEEDIKDLSCVPDDISNGDKIDDNVIIGIDNLRNDEERNDDDDDDAISLCAPTMDDLVLDDNDLQSLREDESFYSTSSSRPYKRMKPANIGRFVSENVREFDALYNNESNIDDTNINIFNAAPKRIGTRWEPLATVNSQNNIPFNFNQHQQFNFQPPIATTSRIQTRINNSLNNNNNDTFNDMKFKFKGHCFSTLRRDICTNANCKFGHEIRNNLICLYMESPREIKSTLIYAITEKFFNYLKLVYANSIKKLEAMEIIEVFSKILAQSYPNIIQQYIKFTIDAFLLRCKKIQQFVDCISNMVQQSTSTADDNIPLILIDSLSELIEDGKSWEILRNLILKLAFPTQQIIEKVLNECTKYPKSSQHIRDIEINIINRLDENILIKIDATIIEKFNKLVDDLKNSDNSNNSQTQEINPNINLGKRENMDSSSIASPDTTTLNNINNNINNNYIDVDNNVSNERNGGKHTGINMSKGISTDLRSRLGVRKADTTLEWKLHKIDNISIPSSVHKSALWLFHKDFELLKESLVRKDYEAVSRTLEITKRSFTLNKNKFQHLRNFYRILCKTILETPADLEKIILITVHNGMATAPDFLQMLLNVGINILKKLIHIEAWIVAHRMLKVLTHYYGGANNVCNCYKNVTTASFVLLSVEIYIANRRPLKAFDLIKQNNLMTHDRNKWKVSSEDEDEELRLLILSLLLKSLCIQHVEYAFSMYTSILKEQNDNFTPSDLSKYTDSIILGLIKRDRHDDLIEMIDLMLKYHSVASPMVIRSAVVNVFHLNQVLSRQLHKHALELHIYRQIQHPLNGLSFILPVDVNWTEEEMFFMMEEYLEKLHSTVGKNLKKIKSRELILYLNFEIYPSLSQLYFENINSENFNNMELIVNAKRAMKNVLDRFDPVIRFLTRTQDQRLCKFVNYTVVNYLKAHCSDY